MLQEQVAEYLDIRGIQRKYPGTDSGRGVADTGLFERQGNNLEYFT